MASKYMYQKYISNDYLGKSKTIKAQTSWELKVKVNEQVSKWEAQEEKLREKERIEDIVDECKFDTEEALEKIDEFTSILSYTLSVDDVLDWNSQKDFKPYKEFKYTATIPTLENVNFELKVPKKSFFEVFSKNKKKYREDLEQKAREEFENRLHTYETNKTDAYNKYLESKSDYILNQENKNKEIDDWKEKIESGDKNAIEKYVSLILSNSCYPDELDKDYEIQFIPENKFLIISYKLPEPNTVPNIVEYKYVKSKDEITEKYMKKADFEPYYENVIYQMTLRTIHEVFESLYIPHVDVIVFNGWVEYTDAATGQDSNSCIISVQVSRDEFLKINLEKIDPKACIKSLKGLFAGKLISLTPVKPLLDISREDSRFIESKDILSELNSPSNLASMPWEDFEHLIRQLFERMFNSNGAEVKVTQASRDGGVDAVAFDPDPIKGGKFVIQAKRYNNVVGVSAARDLYGTMIHEGATKGILVTTSHFGKDSYEFVKDKPLSLIDGNNLLSLFNQYGYSNLNITLKK